MPINVVTMTHGLFAPDTEEVPSLEDVEELGEQLDGLVETFTELKDSMEALDKKVKGKADRDELGSRVTKAELKEAVEKVRDALDTARLATELEQICAKQLARLQQESSSWNGRAKASIQVMAEWTQRCEGALDAVRCLLGGQADELHRAMESIRVTVADWGTQVAQLRQDIRIQQQAVADCAGVRQEADRLRAEVKELQELVARCKADGLGKYIHGHLRMTFWERLVWLSTGVPPTRSAIDSP